MNVPPAGLIEAARDALERLSEGQKADQRRELVFALGGPSEEFIAGYQLGLQTMRVMIAELMPGAKADGL